jgi:hypothetical protein
MMQAARHMANFALPRHQAPHINHREVSHYTGRIEDDADRVLAQSRAF